MVGYGVIDSSGVDMARRDDIDTAHWIYKKKFAWLDTCIYCGCKAEQLDHVLPVSFAAQLNLSDARVIKEVFRGLYLVPCCGECNRIASSKPFFSILEKRKYIQAKLRNKYSKLLHSPDWDVDEIEELEGTLRRTVIANMVTKYGMFQRVLHPRQVMTHAKLNYIVREFLH